MFDKGKLHYTLGNSIIRNKIEGWTFIHQEKYLTNKLLEYNMMNCNLLSTPIHEPIQFYFI